MIKMVFLANRKPGMSLDEFQRYWRDSHALIASKIPGLRKYTQQHTVHPESEAPAPFDGLAEMWFANAEALDTPEFEAAIADTANFLDPDRSHGFVVEVHEIVPLD